jgi:predicted GNAT family N-acyltransferase
VGWFVRLLQAFVAMGLQLAADLVKGLLGAPATAVARATAPIEVRRASVDELLGVRHEVLRPGRPRSTAHFDGDDAPATRHWAAWQADRVVGVVSVMEAPQPEGDARWQLRGMAVLPGLQGQGVGSALLLQVHGDVAEPMWCNARQSAEAFYQRHGWQGVSEPFVIEPIGPHRRMRHDP